MLRYIALAAVMIAGCLALTVALLLECGTPVAQHAGPKFPSHFELALGAVVISSFAVAGWMVGQ